MDDNVLVQDDRGDQDEDAGQAVDHVEHVLLDQVGWQEAEKESWWLFVKHIERLKTTKAKDTGENYGVPECR